MFFEEQISQMYPETCNDVLLGTNKHLLQTKNVITELLKP